MTIGVIKQPRPVLGRGMYRNAVILPCTLSKINRNTPLFIIQSLSCHCRKVQDIRALCFCFRFGFLSWFQ